MAGPGLKLLTEVTGAIKAQRDLEAMGKRAEDVRPLDHIIRGVFLESEKQRFAGENQRPKWPPLADSTKAKKSAEGQNPATLRLTDTLYKSLTEAGAAGQVDEPKPGEFRFGTKVPYAFYHDTGTGVPKRKLVGLTTKQRAGIKETVSHYIATDRREHY